MNARNLIAALVQLGEQDPETLDATVEFTCSEIEDACEIDTVRHWRRTITLSPVEDDDQVADLPDR
ncbi:hypothetical protein EDC02_5001 [Micromonospora sp. Llam0]|uniref:hypothetical protein n=1 Tax=Micromonospora sp. Llam0 TaxID=2485143 RepID=UPI000F480039|nr:hypothetical protein [Micromonospora sp. Llam0]ROO62992.1 hypothetical protein EDC02_5001 [Micromonospora sp. Llam0]